MFLNSDFGKRVAAEIEQRGNELAAENRQIEAELAAAEQELTERRAGHDARGVPPARGCLRRARAGERGQAQAAKSRALNALLGSGARGVSDRGGPGAAGSDACDLGASVVLERRSVFISTNSSDITAEAIARLNAVLGAGTQGTQPPQD